MRADIIPGAIFPDYELSDHTAKRGSSPNCRDNIPLTIALRLGASSHDGKVLVAPRSTSLINSCPRCAISLAGTWRNPTSIPRQPDRRRVDSR